MTPAHPATVLGDPQSLAFDFDVDAPDAAGGALWIDGIALTAYVEGTEVRTRVDAPWPAVARWLVHHWASFFETNRWPIASRASNALRLWRDLESRIRRANDEQTRSELAAMTARFRDGHRLGGRDWPAQLPSVFLSRDGDDIVVAWTGPEDSQRRFLAGEGEGRIPIVDWANATKQIVAWATGRPGGPTPHQAERWLHELADREGARTAIRHEAGLPEATVEALLARTQLDFESFFAVAPDALDRGGLISAFASPVALAFRSTGPGLDEDSLLALRALIVEEPINARAQRILAAIRERLERPPAELPDFEQGYAMATTVRRWLGKHDQPLDIEALLTRTLCVPVRDIALPDADVEGGCVCGDETGPMVFVNTEARMGRTAWGRRMTLAHELCHLLLDRPPQRTLGHVSGAWSIPRLERRANAFAAELLLPQGALMAARDRGADYAELMDTYGVGVTTATWQARNRLGEDLPGAHPPSADTQAGSAPARGPSTPTAGPSAPMTPARYQVLYALLAEPDLLRRRPGDIAQRAAASIADVDHVLARLTERGALSTDRGVRRLRHREALAAWWLTGYADVVRPLATLATRRVHLPGDRDAALDALAARLDAQSDDWLWSGEAAAWIWTRSLRPEHLVVMVDAAEAPDLDGPGHERFELKCLRLFCPAARGAGTDRTVHPLLVWSELLCSGVDPRVRELANGIASDRLGFVTP